MHISLSAIQNQVQNLAFQMSTSSAKRKIEAPEEDSLSRKRIALDSKLLTDIASSDGGVSRVQLEEQVWMVQWYNLLDLLSASPLISFVICTGGIHSIKNIRRGMETASSL